MILTFSNISFFLFEKHQVCLKNGMLGATCATHHVAIILFKNKNDTHIKLSKRENNQKTFNYNTVKPR